MNVQTESRAPVKSRLLGRGAENFVVSRRLLQTLALRLCLYLLSVIFAASSTSGVSVLTGSAAVHRREEALRGAGLQNFQVSQ